MKKIYAFIALNLMASMVFAQIPAGYYNSAAGLTSYPLKTQLSAIITNGHNDMGYSGLWTAYQTTDIDKYYDAPFPTPNKRILDMYSENPTGPDPYVFTVPTNQCGQYGSEGDCYNREHTVPQSLFNSASPMRNDIHFIPPVDGKVNGMRSDYPYGVVTNPTWTSLNGSKLGPNSTPGFSGVVFEPINEFKGDIARMIFYFVTRYQSKIPTFGSGNMLDGTTGRSLTQWELDVLLAWHDADPVSQREIDRNNACYAFQGNRNPYIDHPEYVHQVWGYTNTTPDTTPPSQPTNVTVTNITGSNATAMWTASTDNIAVSGYNVYINGNLVGSSGSTTFNISGLNPNTQYTVTIIAFDAAGNTSPVSSGTVFTTTNTPPATGNSSELYFSEYVEGNSNNKTLEITNATADPIDLSNYTIQKQSNGSGSWVNPLPLSGTIQPNTAFVLKNSAASFTCPFTANMTVNGAPLDFNGNDPVGLFKNGVLIDIIGTYNGGSPDFAVNVTLRRNVSNPSTTFSLTQWDTFAVDTCNNLGIPNPDAVLGTAETPGHENISVYPNPVRDGKLYIKAENLNKIKTAVIYTLDGRMIKSFSNPFRNSDHLNISGIPNGVYILNAGDITEKVIVKND